MSLYQTTTSTLQQEYRLDIWNALYSLISAAINDKPSNLMFRLTLKYPEMPYPHDNGCIEQFMESFGRYCSRKNYKPRYLWVKEFGYDSIVNNFHYHVWVILDGHEIRNPFSMRNKAVDLWGRAIKYCAEGLANIDELNVPGSYTPHGLMIRRNGREFNYLMGYVLDKAQYLAKAYSKEFSPYKGKMFGMSQVPRLPESESREVLFNIVSGR